MINQDIDLKQVESGLLSWGPPEEGDITCSDGSPCSLQWR